MLEGGLQCRAVQMPQTSPANPAYKLCASSGVLCLPDTGCYPGLWREQADLQQTAGSARLLAVTAQQLRCGCIQLLQVTLSSSPCQVLDLHSMAAGEPRKPLFVLLLASHLHAVCRSAMVVQMHMNFCKQR